MRILLSQNSKKRLLVLLKNKYNSKTINELSVKINSSPKTIQSWFYLKERYIPENIIEDKWYDELKIIEKKENNWGAIKGGKESYSKIVDRVGLSGVKKYQSKGGKKAALAKSRLERKKFKINIKDTLFLEFYGILLGDGWISNFKSKNKKVWIIGISSNLNLDKEFTDYYRDLVFKLFNRKGTIRIKRDHNVSEFIFWHKFLLKYLNKKLRFPIGKKENIQLPTKIRGLPFHKLKYVIRGLFDTDGSFYLEKDKKGINSYPIISFHMGYPKMVKQIYEILKNKGFKVSHDKKNNILKIKGREQLKKWMNEIGSSNNYKLNKIKEALGI